MVGTSVVSASVVGTLVIENAQSRGVLELSVRGDFRYTSPNAILKLFWFKNGGKSVSNDP